MIDHESVLKAGKGAASLNDFVYCRVACEFTPGGTKDLRVDYISHHSSTSVKVLNTCSGVEVHHLPLNCSGVDVQVAQS